MDAVMRQRWVAKAKLLARLSVYYNIAEAFACAWFGSRDASLSLLGFGADSLAEAAAAGIVLWRFSRHLENEGSVSHSEHRAHRWLGVLLLILALALMAGGGLEWWQGKGPKSGFAAVIISVISQVTMMVLFLNKRQAAEALQSPVLRADAFCTLSCMWLSALLLLGSFLFSATHLPLFDGATSMAMALLIVHEGWENWEESECECP